MKLEGYSDYEIYPETGQVWSYKRGKYIGNKHKGYIYCALYNDEGVQKTWQVHRLIWTVVNGKIPEGMQINHIDENPLNNSISNLNLMTPKENSNWGTRITRLSKTKSKPVVALKDDKVCMYFTSATETENKGFCMVRIVDCCNNKPKRKTHKGYQWKYMDDYLADWWEQEMEKALN